MEFSSRLDYASTAFKRDESCVTVGRFLPLAGKLTQMKSKKSLEEDKLTALKLLHEAILHVYNEEMTNVTDIIEGSSDLAGNDYDVLKTQALLLFHYGTHRKKTDFLKNAAAKLALAQANDINRFNGDFGALLLTAQIFSSLFGITNDMAHSDTAVLFFISIEMVIDQQFLQDYVVKEFYHAWGRHLHLTARFSQEVSDLTQSLKHFQKAEKLGASSNSFYVDYAEVLSDTAVFFGDIKLLRQSQSFLQRAIFRLQPSSRSAPLLDYLRAWNIYAVVGRRLFDLTHRKEDFQQANKIFHEAILVLTEEANLWLLWGEMFIVASWVFKNPADLEIGLEKLTSLQCQTADPFYLSGLLSLGLSILGVFLEDPNLIKEGLNRVKTALKLNNQHPFLLYGGGMAFLCQALYFGNDSDFSEAVVFFQKALEVNPLLIAARHGLFHAYLVRGNYKLSFSLLQKAEKEISFLTSVQPYSQLYANEHGIVLLCLHNLTKEKNSLNNAVDSECFFLEKSLECFEKACELGQTFESFYNKGCTLIELGHCTGLVHCYEQAVEALLYAHQLNGSTQTHYYLALALFHLGKILGDVKKLHQAEELLLALVNFEAENDVFWNLLGRVFFELATLNKGQTELKIKAEKSFKQSIGLGNVEAHYHLACLYSEENKEDLALTWLKKASCLKALPSKKIILQEQHLSNLQNRPEFLQLLEQCESSRERQM